MITSAEAQVPQQVRPKLVVSMVVDQLRPDLLERYAPAFSAGFVRLREQGYSFTQASHGHARTSTAPGHATLSTGVFPSRHAVVANAWAQRTPNGWQSTYAVADTLSPILGFEQVAVLEGRSPRTMLRDALPDWLLAQDEDARVVSVSKKDRAAIPMGGQHAEHVYWILPELGRFITSRYYMDGYPGWVERFNRDVMPGISADTVWSSEVPPELVDLARPDAAAYELDGVHSTFPHVSRVENPPGDDVQQHNVWAYDQSRADRAVLEFAKTAIEELDLGQRDEQDLLAISLSATDRIGHPFGPFSQEQLSNLIHLDRILGDFFDYLDEVVGEGQWLLGFSADHGVMTPPEAQVEMGIDPEARRFLLDERRQQLGQALQDAAAEGGTIERIAERLAWLIEERDLVAGAYTHREITLGMPSDSFGTLFRNSYYPGRAWGPLSRWGVEIRFPGNHLVELATGTNHESTYWHDRHVPMVFMGAGVSPGSSAEPVYTVDYAPTLAGLAGIPIPQDLDGRRIY